MIDQNTRLHTNESDEIPNQTSGEASIMILDENKPKKKTKTIDVTKSLVTFKTYQRTAEQSDHDASEPPMTAKSVNMQSFDSKGDNPYSAERANNARISTNLNIAKKRNWIRKTGSRESHQAPY